MSDEKLRRLAEECDWGQVVANGGPPCFYIETDARAVTRPRFCLRAERYAGHTSRDEWPDHPFVSLASLLRRVEAERDRLREALRVIRDHGCDSAAGPDCGECDSCIADRALASGEEKP